MLIDQMCSGFAILDLLRDPHGNAVDCEFKAVNPAFEKLTGLSAQEVVGRKLTEVIPESDPAWIGQCERVASGSLKAKFSKFFTTIGKGLEVTAFNTPEGQVGAIISDITALLKAQFELRQSEEGFRSAAENAPEAIFIAPGYDGPYLFANRRASELTGYSVGELLGIGPVQMVPMEECDRIRRRMEMRLKGESVQETYPTTLLRKDGQVAPVEVSASRVVWQGRPAVLILVKDVSKHALMEGELEKRVLEFRTEWHEALRSLELKEQELAVEKENLNRTNRELVKTNTALSALARNIDHRRDDLEKRIAYAISSTIMPLLNELRTDKLPAKSMVKIDVLSTLLADLAPEGSRAHEVIAALSATELRVAMMIKNGFSSDRIAGMLNMSPHTIKTHRRSIRRKLGLRNSKVNLSSYLKLKLSKESIPASAGESPPPQN